MASWYMEDAGTPWAVEASAGHSRSKHAASGAALLILVMPSSCKWHRNCLPCLPAKRLVGAAHNP